MIFLFYLCKRKEKGGKTPKNILNVIKTVMKDRIRMIMEAQHMSQQVFAQFIEMSPASLSSIFNDRTKPTLNMVEAIKKKIPDINTDWLMFGSGTMYIQPKANQEATLFDTAGEQEQALNFENPQQPTPQSSISGIHINNGVRNTRPELIREEIKYIDKPQRKVTEIRVYYDDLTFESFVPAKK